ncbi:MAG: MFS transporter [archaeon]|nr:MFS transporter [archaeon]
MDNKQKAETQTNIPKGQEVKSKGNLQLVKKGWPTFFSRIAIALTNSAEYINIIIISKYIMWPGEDLHYQELSIVLGFSIWMIAISGLIFGQLADRFSRKKLISFVLVAIGLSIFLTGFIPGGQGYLTYNLFSVCLLIRSFFQGGIYPLLSSFTADTIDENERSQYYGVLQMFFQVFQISGMVISSLLFQNLFWREYYWFFGLLSILEGVIILIKAIEPKRGAIKEELRDVLVSDDIEYNYKLNKETIRTTIITPTNLIAFFEGIFTTILISIPDFLVVAYLESPPYNYKPLAMSVIMIVTGIPGAIIGPIIFAKLSDRLGKRNIRNRLYMITFSIIMMYLTFLLLFYIPLPKMTPEESLDTLGSLQTMFLFPTFIFLALLMFSARMVMGIYNINQPPILQKVNLPEAQGSISSANQFLEAFGSGLGLILGGFLLSYFNGNYQITVLVSMSIGIIGGFLWLLAAIWIKKDVARISNILSKRATELNGNYHKNNNKIKEQKMQKVQKIQEITESQGTRETYEI